MKIRVSSQGNIQFEEIYNPIELVADDETLVVCQRDGGFEIRRPRHPGGGGQPTLPPTDMNRPMDTFAG